jgi:hypothetical protein
MGTTDTRAPAEAIVNTVRPNLWLALGVFTFVSVSFATYIFYPDSLTPIEEWARDNSPNFDTTQK